MEVLAQDISGTQLSWDYATFWGQSAQDVEVELGGCESERVYAELEHLIETALSSIPQVQAEPYPPHYPLPTAEEDINSDCRCDEMAYIEHMHKQMGKQVSKDEALTRSEMQALLDAPETMYECSCTAAFHTHSELDDHRMFMMLSHAPSSSDHVDMGSGAWRTPDGAAYALGTVQCPRCPYDARFMSKEEVEAHLERVHGVLVLDWAGRVSSTVELERRLDEAWRVDVDEEMEVEEYLLRETV